MYCCHCRTYDADIHHSYSPVRRGPSSIPFFFLFFSPLIALFSPRFVRIVARESREFLVVVVQGIHEESTRNALGLCMSEAPYASNRLFFRPSLPPQAQAGLSWHNRRQIGAARFHRSFPYAKNLLRNGTYGYCPKLRGRGGFFD